MQVHGRAGAGVPPPQARDGGDAAEATPGFGGAPAAEFAAFAAQAEQVLATVRFS